MPLGLSGGSSSSFWFGIICLAAGLFLLVVGDDFYGLLQIDRDADDRTIRRAFKKLAMTYHPDKNKDDPDAHDKFIKINRAYEVLKDEDLRKRYDLHGEEGLKDDFHGGFQHQSWQFFKEHFGVFNNEGFAENDSVRNSGIYDEDPEIVTLNRADFEQSVSGSENTYWFINFYSPQCSHCHQLAPTWRLVARELESIVRIGAVNCGDDFMLCQEQGIFSYPSLLFYPAGEQYSGNREKDDMVQHVMNQIPATVLKLNEKNVKPLSQEWDPYSSLPWIVDFCDESESCLSVLTRKKISVVLDGLFNVGTVSCVSEKQLCAQLGRLSGVAYFPARKLDKDSAKGLESFDAKELATMALKFLPDMKELTEEEFFVEGRRGKTAELLPSVFSVVQGEGSMFHLRNAGCPYATEEVTERIGRSRRREHTRLCETDREIYGRNIPDAESIRKPQVMPRSGPMSPDRIHHDRNDSSPDHKRRMTGEMKVTGDRSRDNSRSSSRSRSHEEDESRIEHERRRRPTGSRQLPPRKAKTAAMKAIEEFMNLRKEDPELNVDSEEDPDWKPGMDADEGSTESLEDPGLNKAEEDGDESESEDHL